ncbi:WecB/TagA/CpsF family glycosyltransferase [Aliifodinibius sp. S!AR15-10]|uniref:WecB/TagA/CpsF family glycosyltransferase n=1 Tax=Aliifodinibius sp. S!AR15-10 TaxID=2950437 RepID=UPI00285A3250|nr:WecB/TagA/CpsF family glycosyltransferase [Aliifodinibius sp. S!AR15-10]MDR8393372.1 WecB/TagA/CpsF family glycosyltransferase [Aliifodinibius sp. S!AR15-10]
MSKSLELMGYRITENVPSISFENKTIINTINPHSFVVAEEDEDFKAALLNSDYLLPDGVGIVHAAKLIKNRAIPRITGPDYHEFVLSELNKEGGSCFYLGSSLKTLKKIEKRLRKEYPKLNFDTYSPPFKEKFSEEDNELMVEKVNAFKPDALFVGMTAPKQEKWVYKHHERLEAKVICSIGAAFDFFAGTKKRPARIWDKLGLSWLPRFLSEPKRLWKRNLISTPLFLRQVAKHKLN